MVVTRGKGYFALNIPVTRSLGGLSIDHFLVLRLPQRRATGSPPLFRHRLARVEHLGLP